MEEHVLQQLGLTHNEARVYLFLLERGTTNIITIARELEIHRVNVYDILKRLAEKGLVSYIIEGKNKYFSASDPDLLLKIIQEKEQLLRDALPRLKHRKQSAKGKHKVEIYQGKAGIKTIFEDMLRSSVEINVFGAQGKFQQTFPDYFPIFSRRRIEKKITMNIIYSQKFRSWGKKNPKEYTHVCYISKVFESPSTTLIYGKKVAILMWAPLPLGILVESEELAQSYKEFFKILWSLAKKS